MDFSLTTLFVLPNGNLTSDGFKRENLQPGQFGIFNSRYKAVTSASDALKSPHIVFGQGRIENVPGLTHKYSDKVSRGSLIEWYKTTSSPTAKNQITYAGFDGLDNTKTLKAGCDQQYSLTVRARSLYIDQAWAYGLTRTVTVTTPCCEDCGDDCETIDPRWLANAFAQKLNEEPVLSKFIVASTVFDCDVDPTPATVINTITYCLTVCDNGDVGALAAIQSQYSTDVVTRSERVGSYSTYQMERLSTAGAPANAVISQPVRLSVCDVCPATYTLQPELQQYIIETPLDGSEDLNSAADKQTFANTIAALYQPTKTFAGDTAVDPTTDQITVNNHGYVTGQPVTYSNGGGTSPTGLTTATRYYVIRVDANNFKLATTKENAIAGTAVNITADGAGASNSVTPVYSASFLENKVGSAKILLKVDKLFPEITIPVAADEITLASALEALCIPPAGVSTAWTSCDTGFKVQRTLTLTVTNDCAADLADVQAHYPGMTVTLAETGNCNSRYTIVQTSDTIHENCETAVAPAFADLQPYKGIEWTPVEPTLDGSGCQAGVKIEGKMLDKYGNPCEPIAWQHEYDKLTFEVFAYKGAPTTQDYITYDRCDNIPITTTQRSTYALGSGDEVYKLELRYHSYQTTMKHIFDNIKYNGGFVRYSDPQKFYDTYVLKFKSPDLTTWSNETRQDETVIFAVPSGEGAALENFLIGYFGVEKFTAGVLSV